MNVHECEILTCKELERRLHEKIKGYIKCRVEENDAIKVEIKHGDFDFNYIVYNLLEKVHIGFDHDRIVYDICRCYSSCIRKKYFY